MTSNKITSRYYIAKYVFLKILFGEYKIDNFIPSESVMAKYFNTTNLTIRSSYNILITLNLIKPIKGKGYLVVSDAIDYFWPVFSKVSNWQYQLKFSNNNVQMNFSSNDMYLNCKWFIDDQGLNKKATNVSDLIRNIFQTKINIDNFLNLSIKFEFEHKNNDIYLKLKYLDSDDNELLSVVSNFNIKDINYFLSSVKKIKII